ncbi:MAG TPA: serine/threonine-protein kinase [Kofleriaceae bacterium]|jgi:serine/threonine-protein kinase|nr:serine/threonine-protein kinase [Kofleriaceae bacterium]
MAGAADEHPQQPAHHAALPSGETTALLPAGEVPSIAPLARALASPPAARPAAAIAPVTAPVTAIDAMRDEEIARTRLFIRMGWLLSLFGIGTVPVIDAPRALAISFVAGVVIGMIVSFGYHRAFADPRRYTRRALLTLAVICVVNGHLAVLLYGTFSAAPILIVIGIHFVARTEAERIARGIFAGAAVCYAAIAAAIASGAIADPGVFASDVPTGGAALAAGALFVLATFWLAYYTARQFRAASLAAIDDLQRATRLASQRAAMMDELLGDLERARAGPGRHTDQVIGELRLGAVLGRGAMGEVYDARWIATGAPAAVKLLRPGLAGDPAQRARFARELAAGRAIDSPHVVRILGGSAGPPGDAPAFLAMERLHGATLAELLRREPRLPADALRALTRQIGAALDAAAAAGVVHRDVKPTNLFRCDDGTWKILDFGVARIAAEPAPDEPAVIGTPHYMAPEQALGQPAGPAADLHALGAIAYRCATGRPPYDAADPAALLYAIVHRMPARPSTLAELPADLDRVCAIALAKAPGDRFASGAALAGALDAALAGALDAATRARADALIRRRPWEVRR